MRWKTNKNKTGQKRIVRRFAFLPVQLDNEITVWLERYWVEQEWVDYPEYRLSCWVTIRTYSE